MDQNELITVLQAVGQYVIAMKKTQNPETAQSELNRFVQWSGPDRILRELKPPEIGEYAERLGGPTSTSDATVRLRIVKDFLSYAHKHNFISESLAQHVRVRKSKSIAKKAQISKEQETIELTQEGLSRLKTELKKLKADRGPLAIQIRKAAADKDVRENVPLEAAREQLGLTESRILTIENTLQLAVVINSSGKATKRVVLGSRVSIEDMGNQRKTTYRLVSATEANPLEGKISDVSPLGKALLLRYVGEEVEVETPRGKTRYHILKATR